MLRKVVAVLALGALTAGCSSGPTNGQIYGTAGGAALGAGIGRAVAATAARGTWVGALGGAVVGFAIGTTMDPPAEEKHAHATISVAEDGKPVAWSTEKGSKGAVTPVGVQYTDRSGRFCRSLKQDVTIGDEHSAREVTACQAKDGTWVVTEYRPDQAD
ncbi:MAG: RT0821/Lpp0805 family surface protein [Magnetospirillum sp.]|nr:RT0821/Lpp0805 family surface protein [Magnetospirillum sp.]